MSSLASQTLTLTASATLTVKQIRANKLIRLDASGGALTMALPANPPDGLRARFLLVGSSTNIATLGRNGNTIDGAATDQVLNSDQSQMQLYFTGGNWVKEQIVGSGQAQRPATIAADGPLTQQEIDTGLVVGDTSGGAVTATLPATPREGTRCIFRREGANDFILDRNGSTIDGAAANLTLDTDNDSAELQFSVGDWKIVNQRDLP